MGRKSRLLKANLYEDYDYLEEDEALLYSNSPTSTKTEKKKEKPQQQKKKKDKNKETTGISNIAISSKPVECSCNFCKGPIQGVLLNIIYNPSSEVYIPFIEYTCTHCGKTGKRTVSSKALPVEEFENKYF